MKRRGLWGRTLLSALLVVGLILLAGLTSRPRGPMAFMDGIFGEAMAPLEGVVSRVTGTVRFAATTFIDLFYVEATNRRLQAEVHHLQWVLAQNQSLLQENGSLRASLGLHPPVHLSGVTALVIGRTPSTWFDQVVIDRGSTSGVAVGMPVVSDQGAVGTVVQTTAYTATVSLLISSSGNGAGALVVPGGAVGVVRGNGNGLLQMTVYQRRTTLRTGQTVVTSGMDGLFPKGIPVGKILSTGTRDFGLVRSALLLPGARFGSLTTVTVLRWQGRVP